MLAGARLLGAFADGIPPGAVIDALDSGVDDMIRQRSDAHKQLRYNELFEEWMRHVMELSGYGPVELSRGLATGSIWCADF